MFVKNMPGYLFWVLLPLHLAMNLVSVVWFMFQGQAATILRAKRDAIKGLPKAWRKRAVVQSRRSLPANALWAMLNKAFFPSRRQSRANSST
jgi:hypothetical protein